MNTLSLRFLLPAVAGLAALGTFGRAAGVSEDNEKKIPEALKAWEAWAVWNDPDRDCPASYQDAKMRICAWPSRLELQVEGAGAHFGFNVTVFRETLGCASGRPEFGRKRSRPMARRYRWSSTKGRPRSAWSLAPCIWRARINGAASRSVKPCLAPSASSR